MLIPKHQDRPAGGVSFLADLSQQRRLCRRAGGKCQQDQKWQVSVHARPGFTAIPENAGVCETAHNRIRRHHKVLEKVPIENKMVPSALKTSREVRKMC